MEKLTVSSCLEQATSTNELENFVGPLCEQFQAKVVELMHRFANGQASPLAMFELEQELSAFGLELNRCVLNALLNRMEISEIDQMPGTLHHGSKVYRRLSEKTNHSNILTLFGTIELTRATYRQGREGKTIAPLEKALGIENGATPAALDLVGREMAATGASQERAIENVVQRTGARMGAPKLRKLTELLADRMSPLREQFQLDRLRKLTEDVLESQKKPVLSISRDGVTICIAPTGHYGPFHKFCNITLNC
jgi:hypothetical protein